MHIALIAAMTETGVIGQHNKLPWHIPEELKYFKKMTLDKPIIMGRKTFESMGSRPLPGRQNIILTQDKHFVVPNCIVVHSIEETLSILGEDKEKEAMIIGGANIYQQFLPLASRLYLTIIHKVYPGDAYFPIVDWDQWTLVSSDAKSEYTIKVFDKQL